MCSASAASAVSAASAAESALVLDFPEIELERFTYRLLCRKELYTAGIHFYLVNSSAPSVHKKTRECIIKDGMWISWGDTILRGQVSSVYGIRISSRVNAVLHKYLNTLHDVSKAFASLPWTEPIVVYHGTQRDTSKIIMQEGLKPTFGMLGHAIYFGSFWKAFRFATLTQDYKTRPGAIMRYYAFWPKVYKRNLYGPCVCEKCIKKPHGSVVADHTSEWAKYAQAVLVEPEEGKPISNEEFASLDDSLVLLDSIGYANASTKHHEPFNRTFTII